MNATGLRLLAYARVSDVRGREGPGFISEADQFQRCRSYAEAYGHTIIEQASDLDVSGGVMSRPIFDRFLGMVVDGNADGIIVAKLDRFARSNAGALKAVQTIEDAGGALISVSEQIDSTTAAGRFLRSILFSAAQWERERIGEAWYSARSSAVERGIHVSRHVPPGYVRGPKTKDAVTDRRLYPDLAHADTIREAYRMAAAGETNTAIADYFTRAGLAGSHWASYRISRLLANRVYLGEARSGRGVVNLDAHEPLIDEATFLLAQRDRTEALPTRSVDVSLLSGIVRCAGCSFAMKPQAAGKTSRAIYRCPTVSTHGLCPSPAVITKDRIEEYVIDQFVQEYPIRLTATTTDDDGPAQLQQAAAMAELAYRQQLDSTELRDMIGAADHDRLIGTLYRDWQAKLAAAADAHLPPTPTLPEGLTIADMVERLRAQGATADLRQLLGSGVQAVFVRKAASRRRNLPVSDRLQIVWADDEPLELPRRGHRYEPRPFLW